jgi:hypothetical protein
MPPLARRRAVVKRDMSRYNASNIEKLRKFRLPDENDTFEYWDEFLTAENTPVKQSEIDECKKVMKLYEEASRNMKHTFNKQTKIKTEHDWSRFRENLVRLQCENAYILANLEIRQKRQKEVSNIMDKMDFS